MLQSLHFLRLTCDPCSFLESQIHTFSDPHHLHCRTACIVSAGCSVLFLLIPFNYFKPCVLTIFAFQDAKLQACIFSFFSHVKQKIIKLCIVTIKIYFCIIKDLQAAQEVQTLLDGISIACSISAEHLIIEQALLLVFTFSDPEHTFDHWLTFL